MGVVYEGLDPSSGERVAIKLLLSGRDASDGARRRFRREGRALLRLWHPYVVDVKDVGEVGGQPYLVMEFLAGESLADRLEAEGPLPVAEAVELTLRLADALGHAHARGVLHRDVKPDNVVIDATGAPRLTDFGLTRDLAGPSVSGSALTVRGRGMGTPGFWPSEQAAGDLDALGPPTDVYGLGATLVALLTGEPPHGEPESLAQALALAGEAAPPPSRRRPEISPALDAVCLRALAVDPGDRYPDMGAFAAALGEAARSPAAAGPGQVRGRLLGVALLVLVGVAAGVAAVTWGRRGPAPSAPAGVDPDSVEALLAAARALVDAGEIEEALETARRAVELHPDDGDALATRGLLRGQVGDPEGMLVDLQGARELDLADPTRVYVNLGLAYMQLGDPDQALQHMNDAVARYPDLYDVHFNRGLLHESRGEIEEAFRDYRRAVELDPGQPNAWVNRSHLYAAHGDPQQALADAHRALELEFSWQALVARGNARVLLGDRAGLDDYAEALAACAPEDVPDLLAVRSQLYMTLSPPDVERALADIDEAIRLRPTEGVLLLQRADLRGALGDYRQAVVDVDRAIATGLAEPALAEAQRLRAALQRRRGRR